MGSVDFRVFLTFITNLGESAIRSTADPGSSNRAEFGKSSDNRNSAPQGLAEAGTVPLAVTVSEVCHRLID